MVSAHTKQATNASLYPGHNFENLASFLQRSFDPPYERTSSLPRLDSPGFLVTLHAIHASKPRSIHHFASEGDLIKSVEVGKDGPLSGSGILFLRGQPSLGWLAVIGAMLRIDPEYFQSHLDFRAAFGRLDYYPLPSLPSYSNHIIKLRYVTIGHRNLRRRDADQRDIDHLRSHGHSEMRRYLHALNQALESRIGPGDSIVREYLVHDLTHFTIEQDISLCVTRTEDGWVALVWLDTGRDLASGPEGPWLELEDRDTTWPSTSFYPTIQHQPRVGLKPHRTAIPQNERPSLRFVQSASLLPLDYGKFLDPVLMASDPFYAMNDLFQFVAYAEVQFLNMMEATVAEETGYLSLTKESQLTNLLHSHDVFEAHAKRLRQNVETIRFRGGPDWPRTTDAALYQKREAAAESLLRDYEHLLSRAEALSVRCQRGMDVMINKSILTESKKAIDQAQEVTKLTRLAFIYIPLSFTTSIFSMNLKPISDGPHNFWLWLVVSMPILLATLAPLILDISAIPRKAKVAWIKFLNLE